jgi:hypothetical protein
LGRVLAGTSNVSDRRATLEPSRQGPRYYGGTDCVLNLKRFVMNMSDMASKLRHDISDALKRVAGKMSFRKDNQDERSPGTSNRSSMKK